MAQGSPCGEPCSLILLNVINEPTYHLALLEMVGLFESFLLRPELKVITSLVVVGHHQTIRCAHDHDVAIFRRRIGIEDDEVSGEDTGIGKREIIYPKSEHTMSSWHTIFGE